MNASEHSDYLYPTSVSVKSNSPVIVGVVGRAILIFEHTPLMSTEHVDVLKFYCQRKVMLGQWQGVDCEVWECLPEARDIDGFMAVDLRSLLLTIDASQFALVCRAVQLLEWRDNHRFCGRCGGSTQLSSSENALMCHACDLYNYPRISPCVIVVVTRGEYCLLARQAHWAEGLFSAVAGFVEAGESAESALRREVYEEVGVVIRNVRYVGSQSWPFPGQLMLGFIAEAVDEDITVDGVEISEARWWHYSKMPSAVPPPNVMSGALIQCFIEEARQRARN